MRHVTSEGRTGVWLAIGLCLVGIASASGLDASDTAPVGGAKRSLESLDVRVRAADKQVRGLIGTAPCRSDSECRSAAFGALACGGPQAYLAWSTRQTDEVALRRALARHASLRREQMAARGESSICIFLTDPGARCRPAAAPGPGASADDGQCVLYDRGRKDTRQ